MLLIFVKLLISKFTHIENPVKTSQAFNYQPTLWYMPDSDKIHICHPLSNPLCFFSVERRYRTAVDAWLVQQVSAASQTQQWVMQRVNMFSVWNAEQSWQSLTEIPAVSLNRSVRLSALSPCIEREEFCLSFIKTAFPHIFLMTCPWTMEQGLNWCGLGSFENHHCDILSVLWMIQLRFRKIT